MKIAEHLLKTQSNKVMRDKFWHKTGNIFIETARDGAPSGLMTCDEDFYCCLLDNRGEEIGGILMDAPRLKKAIDTLFKSGEINQITTDKTTGYLIPFDEFQSIFNVMAGLDIAKPRPKLAESNPKDDKEPIIITTDGSYRDGGFGGGHVVLERMGCRNPKDNFRITLTWQADVKDSYESELRGVLEALNYLQHGNRYCALTIQCDHKSIVDYINKMADRMKSGVMKNIPAGMPCAKMWQEIADTIQVHDFNAIHLSYNRAIPITKEVHDNATNASRTWKKRTQPLPPSPDSSAGLS